MTERPSLPRTTHAAEFTDPLGNRVRIEVERVRGIGSLDGEDLMGALWEAVSGVWAHTGHGSSPVAVLADHKWHGSDFEEHFNPSTEESDD